MRLLIIVLAFSIVTALGGTPEDKVRASLQKAIETLVLKSGDFTPEKAKLHSSELAEGIFGGEKLTLSAIEKKGITDGDLKVLGYEQTLSAYKAGSVTAPGVYKEIAEFAAKEGLSEIEKLTFTKLLPFLAEEAKREKESASKILLSSLTVVLSKITLYKLENKKEPLVLADLKLSDSLKYKNPVTGEVKNWILLPSEERFKAGVEYPGVVVIVIAPDASDGKRAVGLSQGGAIFLDEKKIPAQLRTKK